MTLFRTVPTRAEPLPELSRTVPNLPPNRPEPSRTIPNRNSSARDGSERLGTVRLGTFGTIQNGSGRAQPSPSQPSPVSRPAVDSASACLISPSKHHRTTLNTIQTLPSPQKKHVFSACVSCAPKCGTGKHGSLKHCQGLPSYTGPNRNSPQHDNIH